MRRIPSNQDNRDHRSSFSKRTLERKREPGLDRFQGKFNSSTGRNPQSLASGWKCSGIVAPEWWATTDIIIPFAATDTSRFPFMEKILSSRNLLKTIGDEVVESTQAYGLFDYGDTHGDGGWGNQESFNDWSAFVSGIRSGDAEALRIALRGAQHYRDAENGESNGRSRIGDIH